MVLDHGAARRGGAAAGSVAGAAGCVRGPLRRCGRRPMSRLRTVLTAATLALMLVVATACGNAVNEEGASQQPQGAALRIRLGTQDFPEARIMGELWRQALAVNGYTVDLQKG